MSFFLNPRTVYLPIIELNTAAYVWADYNTSTVLSVDVSTSISGLLFVLVIAKFGIYITSTVLITKAMAIESEKRCIQLVGKVLYPRPHFLSSIRQARSFSSGTEKIYRLVVQYKLIQVFCNGLILFLCYFNFTRYIIPTRDIPPSFFGWCFLELIPIVPLIFRFLVCTSKILLKCCPLNCISLQWYTEVEDFTVGRELNYKGIQVLLNASYILSNLVLLFVATFIMSTYRVIPMLWGKRVQGDAETYDEGFGNASKPCSGEFCDGVNRLLQPDNEFFNRALCKSSQFVSFTSVDIAVKYHRAVKLAEMDHPIFLKRLHSLPIVLQTTKRLRLLSFLSLLP